MDCRDEDGNRMGVGDMKKDLVWIELIVHDGDGERIEPPRIMTVDAKLVAPIGETENGFTFQVAVDKLVHPT